MDIQKGITIVAITVLIFSNANGQQQLDNGTITQRIDTTPQQSLTLNALSQISKGSEEFSLELLSVNFESNQTKKLIILIKIHSHVLISWFDFVFQRLSRAVTNYNYDFIISPFSIWSLLVLQAEGAVGNTYEQLKKVLRLPDDLTHLRSAYKHIQKALLVNTSTVEVAITQALFSDENRPVDIDYGYKLEQIYEADNIPVNFHDNINAFNKINQYVTEKTRGKINRIVNMDDLRDAQLILISAIFFKGQWKVNSSQYSKVKKK